MTNIHDNLPTRKDIHKEEEKGIVGDNKSLDTSRKGLIDTAKETSQTNDAKNRNVLNEFIRKNVNMIFHGSEDRSQAGQDAVMSEKVSEGNQYDWNLSKHALDLVRKHRINLDALRRREISVYVLNGFDSGQYLIQNTQNGQFRSLSICKGDSSMRFAFVNNNDEIHFSNEENNTRYPGPNFGILYRSSDFRARGNTSGWVLPDTPTSFASNKGWSCLEQHQEGVAGKLPLKMELLRTSTSQDLSKQDLLDFAVEQLEIDQGKRAIDKLSNMILFNRGDPQDHLLLCEAFNYLTRGLQSSNVEVHWAQRNMDLLIIQHMASDTKDTYVMNTPDGWENKGISESIYQGIKIRPQGITRESYKVGFDTNEVLYTEARKVYIHIKNKSVNAHNDGKSSKILIDRQNNKICITDNPSNALTIKFQTPFCDVNKITSNRTARWRYYS